MIRQDPMTQRGTSLPKPRPLSRGKVISDVGPIRRSRLKSKAKQPLQSKWHVSKASPRPAQLATVSPQQPTLQPQLDRAVVPNSKPRRRWLSWLSTLGIITGAMVLGVFSQSLPFGQVFIAVYLILAVILKIKSSTTFILALISLFSMILLLAKGSSDVASTYAVYTFWLIAIGTLSVFLEVKRQSSHQTIHR